MCLWNFDHSSRSTFVRSDTDARQEGQTLQVREHFWRCGVYDQSCADVVVESLLFESLSSTLILVM